MGVYQEKQYPLFFSLCFVLLIAVAIQVPWLLPARELFRQEGLFAVEAGEFDFARGMVTAHGVGIRNGFPLFPALAALVSGLTHWNMVLVIRLISLIMLLATGCVVFAGTAASRSAKDGVVALAVYLTSVIVMEKGVMGTPVTTGAFFLLSAQMLFFYFGVRRNNWNKAWVVSMLLLAVAFLAAGFQTIFFFFFPMLFFRRPLSGKAKFRKPGFVVGVVILLLTVAAWAFPYLFAYGQMPLDYTWWSKGTFDEVLENLWRFPLMLPVRFLPWSLILWLPFCVALQALDRTPIFGRYLRTLFFATAGLFWFLPELDSQEIIYLAGPLAIMCGNSYELGMRRYGNRIRNWLVLVELGTLAAAFMTAFIWLARADYLNNLFSFGYSLGFRETGYFKYVASGCCLAAFLCFVYIFFLRSKEAVYRVLLVGMLAAATFYSGTLYLYKIQPHDKRDLGNRIGSVLKAEGHEGGVLYKSDISDLYGPLFYSGARVVKITGSDNIPETEDVVFWLSTAFPVRSERSWTILMSENYGGHVIGLWKGVLEKDTEQNYFNKK